MLPDRPPCRRRTKGWRARAWRVALPLLLLGAVACRREAAEVRPAGLHVVADGPALARALALAQGYGGTPLGDASARALAKVQGCPRIAGSAPSGALAELLEGLRCGEPAPELAELSALGGGAPVVVASGTGGPWTLFAGRVDEQGTLEGDLSFPREHRGMGTLLSPASHPPGPPLFSRADAVLRGRMGVRGGVDVAKLKTSGKTAEKMKLPDFAGVLSDTLLDGVWELAVYAPSRDRTTPRIALALGVHSSRAALAGMDALIDELENSWQLHRSAFRVGEHDGACLLDLTVLPDLAPCWVLAGDSIVVGWNQESLLHALAPDRPVDETLAAGRLVVDFEAMQPVDEQLTRVAFPGAGTGLRPYPWGVLSLQATGEGRARVVLSARGGQR